jgi:hypothetical protein
MPTTTNFGWTTPADTDLVKDGAAAIRTLGNGIDTSLLDLKGGTTGQVLAKASNTDLDFSWVAQDDSNAIQNAIVDAKGDLITATAADTPARLAVGTNGQVLAANSSTSTGLEWQTISSGAFTELASGTLSSGGTNLTSIAGTYKDLVLVLRNAKTNSDGTPIAVRVNADDGANRYKNLEANSAGSAFDNTRWYVTSDQDNSVANGLTYIRFFDYANTATWKLAQNHSISTDDVTTTSVAWNSDMLAYNQTTAISQINILAYSGTISGGTYILYGVK